MLINADIFIIYLVIGSMFLFLVMNWYSAEVVVLCAVIILVWSGVITITEAFAGFTNEGVLTIAALFVIMNTIQQHPSFSKITKVVFGKCKTHRGGMSRMMIITACFSSIINNTPLVVLLSPIVKKWCKKHSIYPSKFLIPLSYAAIIGGMCTLLGTTTNLVVHTLLINEGYNGFSVFELAIVGVPFFVLALIYMRTIGYRMLPENVGTSMDIVKEPQFIVEVQVSKHFPLIGKTIQEAGLRNLKRCYVMAILRQGECLFPVSPNQLIKESDHLLFVGDTDSAAEINQFKGLNVKKLGYEFSDFPRDFKLVEAIIPQNSAFISNRIRALKFRSKYGGVVVAVYRNGRRINEKIGSIQLRAGDMLYFLTSQNHIPSSRSLGNILFLSNKAALTKVNFLNCIPLLTFGIMIISVSFGLVPITQAAVTTAILFLVLRLTTFEEAKDSIQWEVLFVIGGAIGIATAMIKTGAADYVAMYLLLNLESYGPIVFLVAAYLITNILTELVTNNAAAVIVFPIIMSIVAEFSLNPEPFAVAIAIAASASFSTPIGYQTNLLVYSSGQYKFTDYLKIGIPLNILCFTTSMIIIPIFWPLV